MLTELRITYAISFFFDVMHAKTHEGKMMWTVQGNATSRTQHEPTLDSNEVESIFFYLLRSTKKMCFLLTSKCKHQKGEQTEKIKNPSKILKI